MSNDRNYVAVQLPTPNLRGRNYQRLMLLGRIGVPTREENTIVGAGVVGEVTGEEDGNMALDALFVRVILAGARLPIAVILNMVLPGWVLVA